MGMAHPRSRGEHLPLIFGLCTLNGSSPLARGTLSFGYACRYCFRLIPARAGNTPRDHQPRGGSSAHPRSRGEHLLRLGPAILRVGSSPLARGTPLVTSVISLWTRLIPARAGNTRESMARSPVPAAHPRSRGEHILVHGLAPPRFGSSPLARGTRLQIFRVHKPLRLIPARAGNTAPR